MKITQTGPQNIDNIKVFFENGDLFLSPDDYQREIVWKKSQKQLLIDTIFRDLDIPKFYLWKIDYKTLLEGYPEGETKSQYKKILDEKREENDDPDPYIFEVVDGQQRIRTILEFMGVNPSRKDLYRGNWNLPYPTLKDTPMAKGKMYNQLNPQQKIKFGIKSLSVMILEDTTIEEIRDMFLRLQNGTPLNAQQKRDALGSKVGEFAKELSEMKFFTKSVYFNNSFAAHHLVASQMINLEVKDKIISCSSAQLNKLYDQHIRTNIDNNVISKIKRVLNILGDIFPDNNPHINRSYALSLYWSISRIIEIYDIDKSAYPIMRSNFEKLDEERILANQRDYVSPGDNVFEDLTLSMSQRTDGAEGINDRHKIISQFIFQNVQLNEKAQLDPKREFTFEEKLILYKKANGLCQLEHNGIVCGKQLEFDDVVVDHIVPHSLGGRTELSNGRIAHHLCNNARGNRNTFDPSRDCKL